MAFGCSFLSVFSMIILFPFVNTAANTCDSHSTHHHVLMCAMHRAATEVSAVFLMLCCSLSWDKNNSISLLPMVCLSVVSHPRALSTRN